MIVSELLQVTNRLTTDLPWVTVAKFFDKVDSTQNRILQFLPKEVTGPVLVIAESQTKGVGREGRTWVSPPGGIWFSLALPLGTMPLEKVAAFSLVTAFQVTESLKTIYDLECQLKWPNDVQYQGKKLAGTLLTTVTKFKKPWTIIGVGVNVNNELPADLSKTATSIKAIRKQAQGRSRLIEAILSNIHTAWNEFDRTGFGPYLKGVEARLVGVGKPVQVRMGTKTLSGTMKAIDPQGNLLLESASGVKTVQAGEIVGQPA